MIKLKANGNAQSTLEETSYRITRLAEQCDLTNPEEVKTAIANMAVANGDKQNYVSARKLPPI